MELSSTYTMELSRTAPQEAVFSKKSMALYPTGDGNAKLVLVKHYISPSSRKHQKLKPAFFEVKNAPGRACKRKSLKLVASKENKEQYATVKRRRSVQLGELDRTVENVSPSHQEKGKPQHSSLVCHSNVISCRQDQIRTNSYQIHGQHEQSKQNCQPLTNILQSKTFEHERLDFQKHNQQHDKWNNYDNYQDIVLLPGDWLGKGNEGDSLEINMQRQLKEHRCFFSISQQETLQAKSNGTYKSLFATYNLNKIHKSIVEEM